ncbi:L-aspartate oxidase [Bacillus carboniphilus]|uniref:L-aspartate oxidase n=1 Tax=Bacillus carboniphilus TaxID=86663 RepID=A0ABP3G5G7_9BACI
MEKADVIIVGSGISALQLATQLQGTMKVLMITKGRFRDSNTNRAQGGIAAALHPNDHIHLHTEDTLQASVQFADRDIVQDVVSEGKQLMEQLLQQGFPFDTNTKGQLHFGMEGAHQRSRILHSNGDQTGKAFVSYLLQQLRSNVTIRENEMVFEVIQNELGECIGVKSKNKQQRTNVYIAPYVVLATGGCSAIYNPTSNYEGAVGDGLYVAWRAGARLVNCEFIQFHPTILNVKNFTSFLISEAVRGEGGVLTLKDCIPLMETLHPMKDLAPRHIVAEAIFNAGEVYLDINNIQNFKTRFPSITAACEERGISIELGKIPVQPGAHFLMGGVETDSFGRTNIKGLLAIGELAYTGLHGSNRLASNSLLEGLVMGKRAAEVIQQGTECSKQLTPSQGWDRIQPFVPLCLPTPKQIKDNMMKYVGVKRSEYSLTKMLQWLESFSIDFSTTNLGHYSFKDIETIYMLFSAGVVTKSALLRKESRGAHIRSDYPDESTDWLYRKIIFEGNQVKVGLRKDEFVVS